MNRTTKNFKSPVPSNLKNWFVRKNKFSFSNNKQTKINMPVRDDIEMLFNNPLKIKIQNCDDSQKEGDFKKIESVVNSKDIFM